MYHRVNTAISRDHQYPRCPAGYGPPTSFSEDEGADVKAKTC